MDGWMNEWMNEWMNQPINPSFLSRGLKLTQQRVLGSHKASVSSQMLIKSLSYQTQCVFSSCIVWTRTRNSTIKGLYFIVIVSTLLSFPTSVACFRELWACTREHYGQSGKRSEVGMVSGEVRKPFFSVLSRENSANFKWMYFRRSGHCNSSNCKLTRKKISGLQRDSNL